MIGLRLPIHRPHLDYTKPGPSRRTRNDGCLHLADVRAVRYHQEAKRPAGRFAQGAAHGSYAISAKLLILHARLDTSAVGRGPYLRHRQFHPRRLDCRRIPSLTRGDSYAHSKAKPPAGRFAGGSAHGSYAISAKLLKLHARLDTSAVGRGPFLPPQAVSSTQVEL